MLLMQNLDRLLLRFIHVAARRLAEAVEGEGEAIPTRGPLDKSSNPGLVLSGNLDISDIILSG